MTDLAAILAAVLDRPDDDTPRGVYADCLDDLRQHEHAAFVRAQLEYATRFGGEAQGCPTPITSFDFQLTDSTVGTIFERGETTVTPMPCGSCCCTECQDRASLEARIHELLDLDPAQTLVWFGLPRPWARVVRLTPFDPATPGRTRADFPYAIARRGFIDRVELSAAGWREHAAEIRAAHPVRRVVLTTRPDDADQLHHLVTTFDDPDAERPRILDRWNESPLWPGVKFDLPRRTGAEILRAMLRDAEAPHAAQAREVWSRAVMAMPRFDPAPVLLAMYRAAESVRGFGEAMAAAARPTATALTPIARAMAAVNLQPVHVSRKDRRRRRK
jgi:uncharacterized protein (TIGR02996 family)